MAMPGARAQSGAAFLYQPSLTDPLHTQRFGRAPDPVTRASAPVAPPPPSAGKTGSDFTGAIGKKRKTAKRKPGEARPPPPPPPPPPGPPQQAGGHTSAPQVAARASYADAYRPPDAPPRRPPVLVQDAFEPVGLRIGTFVLKPSIEVTRGYDSNPAHIPNGKSSAFTMVEPALQVRSQWSRHEYGFNLRASYFKYDTLPSSDRPLVDFKSFSRIDVGRDTTINTESRYFLSTDYPGSPNLPADIAKLPIFTTYGTTAGLTQRFNRLELSAKASLDRTTYRDSQLTDGTTSSNHDRDYNQYGGQVRAGYEVTPGIRPFVEISGDSRQHDLGSDRNGFQRDSRSLTPKLGTTFELTRKLTGEVSLGYLTRHYQDPGLPDLTGAVFDSSLVWMPTGLTTATLTGSSRGEEVVVAGVSGALRRDVTLQIDHALRRWLIGTLRFGYGFDQYVGSDRADKRMLLGSAIAYKINREMWLKGEYRYEQLRSNAANVDYNASVFLIGLKLQR